MNSEEEAALVAALEQEDDKFRLLPVRGKAKHNRDIEIAEKVKRIISEVQGNVTSPHAETNDSALRRDEAQPQGEGASIEVQATTAEAGDGYAERLDAVDARIDALDGRIDLINAKVDIAMSGHDDAPDDDSEPIADDSDTDLDIDRLDTIETDCEEMRNEIGGMGYALDLLADVIAGSPDDAKAKDNKRLTAIEDQAIANEKALDKLREKLSRLASMSDDMANLIRRIDALENPPEPEPIPEPEKPAEPVIPCCPVCESRDGWPLENTYSSTKQWYCRRCSKIVDIPSPVKAKGTR
jgi:hypothetical protein